MHQIPVSMNGITYNALTHALIAIGLEPTSGKPYIDEIDKVWRKVRRKLKNDGESRISRNGKTYVIKLAQGVSQNIINLSSNSCATPLETDVIGVVGE